MEITEEKLYSAFGLDPNAGGKDPEPAGQGAVQDGAAQDAGTDGNRSTPEAAEPTGNPGALSEPQSAETGRQGIMPDGGNEAPEEDTAATGEAGAQTEEQRRENAARRRQQEQQAAIQAAVEEALQRRDQEYLQQQETFFQQAGLINPFTKTPITNMDEFRAWREEQDNQKLQRELQSGKLTKETLNELIEQHPAVQAARQQQAEAAEAQQAQQEEAFRQSVEQQLMEIRKTDPSVTGISDLMNRPYSQAFYEAVKRGNNFVDAFYLATRGMDPESMGGAAQIAEAARQSAVNNLTGKNHLKATSIGGKAGATVTADERKMYRLFNPQASDEEIQKYQNKYRKG